MPGPAAAKFVKLKLTTRNSDRTDSNLFLLHWHISTGTFHPGSEVHAFTIQILHPGNNLSLFNSHLVQMNLETLLRHLPRSRLLPLIWLMIIINEIPWRRSIPSSAMHVAFVKPKKGSPSTSKSCGPRDLNLAQPTATAGRALHRQTYINHVPKHTFSLLGTVKHPTTSEITPWTWVSMILGVCQLAAFLPKSHVTHVITLVSRFLTERSRHMS